MTITAYRTSPPTGAGAAGRWPWVAAALAASIAVFASVAGWRGGDLSAHLFRVELFREYGLTLFNPQWYGGHFTLSYSVLYPPIAATLGIGLTTAFSAALAAWCFGQLSARWFGRAGHAGAVLFALGIASPVAIGQLPFLLGEAFALAACVAVADRRWTIAAGLAMVATLTSPVAGAFLAMALVAWAVAVPPDRWRLAGIATSAAFPMCVTAALFPGTGPFPFPFGDALFQVSVIAALVLVVPRRHRALRIGAMLYLAAIVASFAFDTPMGGNVSRFAESFGVPIAACVLWPKRRLAFFAVAIPLLLWQWSPAVPAMTTQPDEPSTHAEYYDELLSFLSVMPPVARIEVVPTKAHFEVAYVAPTVGLARGWERQMDILENPLFYGPEPLTAAAYHSWLLRTGAAYVALSDAPLDFAAREEAAIVRAGVPGLTLVWTGPHWQVFRVEGAPELLQGPAVLESIRGDDVVLRATAPGEIRLMLRHNSNWRVSPEPACFGHDADGWIVMRVASAAQYRLQVGLTPTATPSCS